ncbi:EboA domain-containing protein [Candidatus Thiodictyon syntrophicum]|jgi:hypothetical protein|uniref:Uncharacterized protein n=1 Tax=Candidatus Thiodictyon syntrophicum TaxID=1166950 RepID=A0A2K8U950_9GAMM|nr:EboA domain-containing protein [Candidatus Thiodictyon syntrophicum]AUB82128.1 hypothetical protein THSYN_14995 [Candidatus Thiodictyon syntrophicum]
MSEPSTATAALLALGALLRIRCPGAPVAWLDQAIERIQTAARPQAPLAQSFAAAARHLGMDPLGAAAARFDTPCGPLDASRWQPGDAGRALLLAAAIRQVGDAWVDLIEALYRDGDEGERASLVRALCLTPQPCRLLELARAAGRITSLRLYAALALDNPFPAACYPEHDFNGMVVKCLFNGLPVGRISGLAGRANPDLSRMCEDYREERRLAARAIPADIWLPLVPYASPGGLVLALEQTGCADPEHRYYAVLALSARRSEPRIAQALAARRGVEPDPRVAALLHPA